MERLAAHARVRLSDDDSPRTSAGPEQVLQQFTVLIGMLGRISERLDRIEARLPTAPDDGPADVG